MASEEPRDRPRADAEDPSFGRRIQAVEREWRAAEHRRGRSREARQALAAALYEGHLEQVTLWASWLGERSGYDDPDVTLARRWVIDQRRATVRAQKTRKRAQIGLALTAAPLAMALFLTGLVMMALIFH